MPGVITTSSGRRIELKMDSHPANLAPARKALEQFMGEAGFDALAQADVGLVLNEALANVIRHAYGGAQDRPIEVSARVEGDGTDTMLLVAIRDWGNGVNPQSMTPREKDPLVPGGLGLICLQRLMDDVKYAPQADGGILLTMTRKRNRPQPAAG